jgi:hypothetical protein
MGGLGNMMEMIERVFFSNAKPLRNFAQIKAVLLQGLSDPFPER